MKRNETLIVLWCHLDNLWGRADNHKLLNELDKLRTDIEIMVEPNSTYDDFVKEYVDKCSLVEWDTSSQNWVLLVQGLLYRRMIMSNTFIKLDVEEYLDMLEKRRSECSSWEVEDEIWEAFMDYIRDVACECYVDTPMVVVDNFLVNGDFVYKDSEDCQKRGGWDRVLEDCAFHSENIACMNPGV